MCVEVNNRDNKFIRKRRREKKCFIFTHINGFASRHFLAYIHLHFISGYPNRDTADGKEGSKVIEMTALPYNPTFAVKYDYSHAYMK